MRKIIYNNIGLEIQCPKCHANVDVPYTMEELLSGNELKFTCKQCGNQFEKATAEEAKRKTVEFMNELASKYGNK